jgi:hypothetical protein
MSIPKFCPDASCCNGGRMLHNAFQHNRLSVCDPSQANKVDVVYALSQAWCNSKSQSDFELLEKYLTSLKPEETILVRERNGYASENRCAALS